MSADPRDVFDEVDAETSELSNESPSTAVYLHQVKEELDDEWYQKEHKTERIGAYRIQDKLGEGGMAMVYRAQQLSTDREVAVKVVSLKGGARNDMAQQVFREASALAMIDHPNVISCFGFGEDKGRMYMALEILDGKDTADVIVDEGNKPFELERLFDISLQAIAGFQMVYKAGFIHRDIKPANIFLNNDGVVKVADLGLAWKGADVSMENIKSGAMGTPAYMSPEQVFDEVELDVRSDIYSMGATIFFYATGRTPFLGDDPMEVMKQAITETPPDMREINPNIPEGLCRVVVKAMQKDREHRYPNWKQFYDDLSLVRDGEEPQNADIVNELQQLMQDQGAFVAEKSGGSLNLVIVAFVVVVLAIIGFVVYQNSSEVVTEDDDPDPLTTETVAESTSVYELTGFAAQGEASMHNNYIALNGGVLRCDQSAALIKSIKKSDVFSVELVVTPANNTQGGPARIITFSKTYASRNFTIAQDEGAYEVRVRTSTASSGLRPRIVADEVVKPNQKQHILFVREKGMHVLYVDGVEHVREEVYGHIGNWDEKCPLLLGNDIKQTAAWVGTIHSLDFVNKVIKADDAKQRYDKWLADSK